MACTGSNTCQNRVCAATCDRVVGATLGNGVTDTTIQSAIDAAPDGGRVCIEAGTYSTGTLGSGYLGKINKNLTISGADQATTILDGTGARAGFEIGTNSYSSQITVTIEKLTIQNGYGGQAGGSGLYAWGNSGMTVNLTDVTARNGTYGSGIYIDSGNTNGMPTAVLTRVTATGNTTANGSAINTMRGGGMLIIGNATLTDCDITNNSVNTDGAGLAIFFGSTVTMTGGSISGNTSNLYTGGLYGNAAAFILYGAGNSFTATNVTMTNNVAAGTGGLGANEWAGTLTLTNCTVSGNTAATCNCVQDLGSCNTSYCV